MPDAVPAVDWTTAQTWTFEPLDDEAFPAVRLAREVGAAGGTAPAIYNAANEEAVAAFMPATWRSPGLSTRSLGSSPNLPTKESGNVEQLSDVLQAETAARARARALIYGIDSLGRPAR